MRYIHLSLISTNDDQFISINSYKIQAVEQHKEYGNSKTRVYMDSQHIYIVKETPAQILSLIEAADDRKS